MSTNDNSKAGTAQRRRTTQNHAPIFFYPPPRFVPPSTENVEPDAQGPDEESLAANDDA